MTMSPTTPTLLHSSSKTRIIPLSYTLVSQYSCCLSQDVPHYHSSRPRSLDPVPHSRTISHHLLLHCRGHCHFPRLHDTDHAHNNDHIHSSGIHNDPHASPFDRDPYFHRHSTRKRPRIDRGRNTSVRPGDCTICCAGPRRPRRAQWLHGKCPDTRKRIDPRGHIHTFPCLHQRSDARRSINRSSRFFSSCRKCPISSVGGGRRGFERRRRLQHPCDSCQLCSSFSHSRSCQHLFRF